MAMTSYTVFGLALGVICNILVFRGTVALYIGGKPIAQSSTFSDETGAYKAQNGDPTSCSMTEAEVHPWLRLDLEGVYCLGDITVVNRQDCCPDRLIGATIRAGLSPNITENSVCGTPVTAAQATYGARIRVQCNPPVQARYISVDIDRTDSDESTQYLSVCDIDVVESASAECPDSAENRTSFLDSTCYTSTPLVQPSAGGMVFIGAYLGELDSTAEVSFGRDSQTGQVGSPDLPETSSVSVHPADYIDATLLYLPEADGLDRLGAFYCMASTDGVSTKISIILLNQNENEIHIRPVTLTKTVNIGEYVTLEMRAVHPPDNNYRWRHNSGLFIEESHDSLTHHILNACTRDSGIYECHVNGQRPHLLHGIMKLIVRACPSGRWGPEYSCTKLCPRCYNGGICDDKSGRCVCAPGFRGRFCEEVLGSDIFAQDGSHHCTGSNDPHSKGCRGKLFCLPDPYGCSCAAGFKGLDCMQECEEGTYGADCKQTCHCAQNVSCLPDTGECQGECSPLYTGVNCQHTVCSAGFFGANCSQTCHCASSDRCHQDSGKCEGSCAETYFGLDCQQRAFDGVPDLKAQPLHTNPEALMLSWGSDSASFYTISYELTDRGQCEPVTTPVRIRVPGQVDRDTRRYILTDLEPSSSYRVYVQSHYRLIGKLTMESFAQGTTSSTQNPGPVDGLTSVDDAANMISLRWQPVQCASGYYVSYELTRRVACDGLTSPERYPTVFTRNTALALGTVQPFSSYSVSVSAGVDSSNSSTATIQVLTLPRAPDTPEGQVSLTSATEDSLRFTWDALPCERIHGQFEGYRYVLRQASTEGVITAGITIQTEVTFAGLAPCREYEFKVAAIASGFQSPYTHRLRSWTASVVPEPVGSLIIDGLSTTDIAVSWEPPQSSSCMVTRYRLKHVLTMKDGCATGPFQQSAPLTLSAETTSTTLTGLIPASQYQVSVSAVNSEGAGHVVSMLWTTREAAPSDPPVDVMALSTSGNQSLGFSWSQPACGARGGTVVAYVYKLTAVADGGGSVLVSAQNTSREWAIIDGLEANRPYAFQVAACTSAGVGPYTKTIPATIKRNEILAADGTSNRQPVSTPPAPSSAARRTVTAKTGKLIGGQAASSSPSAIAVVALIGIVVFIIVIAAFVRLRNVSCGRKPFFSGHVRWTGYKEESDTEMIAEVHSTGL